MNSTLKLLSLSLITLATSALSADEVKVDGVHLCCGKCVQQAKASLTSVDGISKVRVNKSAETVVFDATGKDAAQLGLKSLAAAGFYGSLSVDGPTFDVDKTAKKDAVSVSGMHLCCGGCINSAVKAIKTVSGVDETDVAAKDGKISVSGSEISLVAVLKALHEAGMHGEVK